MFFLHEIGLASGFGVSLETSIQGYRTKRSAYVKADSFMGADYRAQVCAFQNPAIANNYQTRCLDLMSQATADLVTRLRTTTLSSITRTDHVDLLLNLAESPNLECLPNFDFEEFANEIIAQISDHLAKEFEMELGRVIVSAGGNAGMNYLFDTYKEENPDPALILVAAVDSFADRSRLTHALDHDELFSPFTQFGTVPGEAAVIGLLSPSTIPNASGPVTISGLSGVVEPVGERDMADSDHTALTEACFAALATSTTLPVSTWISDWNNARYRASELSYANLRLGDKIADGDVSTHTAVHFGDVGAASQLLGLALVAANGQTTALITAGSTHSKLRGAIVVEAGQALIPTLD